MARSAGRLKAAHREGKGFRNKQKVACVQDDGSPAGDRQAALTVEKDTIERTAKFRPFNMPLAAARHLFGDGGPGLQQRDDLCDGVTHGSRTLDK